MKSRQFSFSTAPTEHSSASSCSAFWQISSSLSPGIAPQHPRERSGALRSGAAPLPARLQPPAPPGRRPHPPPAPPAPPGRAGPGRAARRCPPARCLLRPAACCAPRRYRGRRIGVPPVECEGGEGRRRDRPAVLAQLSPAAVAGGGPGRASAPGGRAAPDPVLHPRAETLGRVRKQARRETSEAAQGLVKDGPERRC